MQWPYSCTYVSKAIHRRRLPSLLHTMARNTSSGMSWQRDVAGTLCSDFLKRSVNAAAQYPIMLFYPGQVGVVKILIILNRKKTKKQKKKPAKIDFQKSLQLKLNLQVNNFLP